MQRISLGTSTVFIASFLFLAGCAGNESGGSAPAAKAGLIVGKITFADGKPISTPGAKLSVSVSGVSSAGVNVSFNPAVKADGTYSQKVPDGSYQIRYGKISVPYGSEEFMFDLEPQGEGYAANHDSSEPISQDFVWRVTGPQSMYARGKLDPNNHTHWNGMNVGMRFASYREDLKSSPPLVPPEGSKLVLTLTPVAGKKAIDGSDLTPVTFEREWRPKDITPNDDLNDFLPGEYTLTGVLKLPDGATKPLLFQGKGDYPNFVEAGRVTLEKDGIIGGMWKQLMSWGVN